MVATFALLMAAATAAPLLDVFADPCSGSGELKTDMVGKCYSGGATVLTVSELAVLQIKSYDTATGEGTMRLDTEGVSTIHCPPANFKKVDKAITVDLSACGKIHKALASAEYCSDQDTVRIHVKVPESPLTPGAGALPLVPVTLKPTKCKEAHQELKDKKASAK